MSLGSSRSPPSTALANRRSRSRAVAAGTRRRLEEQQHLRRAVEVGERDRRPQPLPRRRAVVAEAPDHVRGGRRGAPGSRWRGRSGGPRRRRTAPSPSRLEVIRLETLPRAPPPWPADRAGGGGSPDPRRPPRDGGRALVVQECLGGTCRRGGARPTAPAQPRLEYLEAEGGARRGAERRWETASSSAILADLVEFRSHLCPADPTGAPTVPPPNGAETPGGMGPASVCLKGMTRARQ